MDRVLITGGTGFVGSWMSYTKPESITAAFFNRYGYESNVMEHLRDYDGIVHLAPVSPKRVIAYAKKYNARLLYCSSGIVYHPEGDSEYRQNKIKWERECLESGVDVVIARLFTFFGAGLDDGKAITQFYKQARAGKPLQVYGDGSTIRSYMHGTEMGRKMWEILFNGESGKAYDIGSRKPTTILRLAKRIQAFTGAPIEFVDKPVPVPVYVPP